MCTLVSSVIFVINGLALCRDTRSFITVESKKACIYQSLSFFAKQKMSVEELFIYPIKSCGGIKVEEALITKYGLALPSNPEIIDR
jgi:hypothetical protein